MNIQAMMKQAQKLQKEMTEVKGEINKKVFTGQSSFVKVEVNGKKEVLKVEIDKEEVMQEEIELLEDMILISINDAMKQIDNEIEDKMGKYTQGMTGLF